jgi:hypothetical protein
MLDKIPLTVRLWVSVLSSQMLQHKVRSCRKRRPSGLLWPEWTTLSLSYLLVLLTAVARHLSRRNILNHSEEECISLLWHAKVELIEPRNTRNPVKSVSTLSSWADSRQSDWAPINIAKSAPLATRKKVTNHSPWSPRDKQTSSKDIWSGDFHCSPKYIQTPANEVTSVRWTYDLDSCK